jgi:hypothetical protein
MEYILIYVLLALLCTGVGVLAFMLNEFYIDFREFKNKVEHTNFDKFI